MNELSERLHTAVEFLKENGYAETDLEIARRCGIAQSSFCMILKGGRVPTWGLLLDFCDAYPIDFSWIRTGEGDMLKSEREIRLLKRIMSLEEEIRRLKEGG